MRLVRINKKGSILMAMMMYGVSNSEPKTENINDIEEINSKESHEKEIENIEDNISQNTESTDISDSNEEYKEMNQDENQFMVKIKEAGNETVNFIRNKGKAIVMVGAPTTITGVVLGIKAHKDSKEKKELMKEEVADIANNLKYDFTNRLMTYKNSKHLSNKTMTEGVVKTLLAFKKEVRDDSSKEEGYTRLCQATILDVELKAKNLNEKKELTIKDQKEILFTYFKAVFALTKEKVSEILNGKDEDNKGLISIIKSLIDNTKRKEDLETDIKNLDAKIKGFKDEIKEKEDNRNLEKSKRKNEEDKKKRYF